MKLNLIKALLPLLFITQLSLAEGVVNFYNWADYIGESTIRDFEEEYGIKVNYDEYDSSEIVEAKLLAGNSGYDLVVHSSMYSKRLMPLKIFHEIDPAKLSNFEKLDPMLMEMLDEIDSGKYMEFMESTLEQITSSMDLDFDTILGKPKQTGLDQFFWN